ncbi:flavodoxin domain-containing protein [Geodermatophilus ruber]|uniref:Menaquinone-dependent protoporphyrinogen oxidase n=1 Tax=Geodermatophilus ruber TaxID=504800 RepID=A0A1I4E1Y7_9ACTN|nr:flavodoxin domain-containing protein [Geodermatophilus ruber]SFK99795.1 menaquinone-dependent protoporphyrinogen oxidase [Geodermatophilus ruber]
MSPPGLGILVTAASKHGSTHEIAAALARALTQSAAAGRAGLTATWLPAENRPDPSACDAVVLGSAVYAGSWLPAARDLATAHAAVLRDRPLWLFSSGPIGVPPFPPDEPDSVGALRAMLGPRGHRVFPGRLDRSRLTFGERAMVTAMRAPIGDFRDWAAVAAWAEEIADEIAADISTTPLASAD